MQENKKYIHEFTTDDEYFLHCYFKELRVLGYVSEIIYEPYTIILTEGLINHYTKVTVLKTKTKSELCKQVLLKESVYTPDFQVVWRPKARGIFYNLLATGNKITTPFIANNNGNMEYSIIESKPDFDSNNMTRLFVNNQKIIWDKYEQYVNLIENKALFESTFTPKTYTLTPTGKAKKINFPVKTLKEFI